jgi:acyl dehydratase
MPQPFQILQSPSAFFIAYQYDGAVRNVYLKDPGPAPIDSWMGQSVGHWEGESFVVEASGFNDGTWFDRAGNFHSDQLKVVERYTRIQPDVINYRSRDLHAAVEDQHAALSAPREERAADGLQVRGVRRGAAVRRLSQETAYKVGIRNLEFGIRNWECVNHCP